MSNEQNTYTYDEALELAKDYFDGSELEASTFLSKYALKNNDGEFIEATPDHMHRRIAKELARIEQKYPNPLSEQKIYEYLKDFGKIIPQGSPMAGIGNGYQLMSLSNCFVTGSNQADSYGGIMYTDETLAQLMKRRAGVGIDISHLRPDGSTVRNASLSSTGAVSFMHRYSNTTREVAQEGRRGALMITLDVRHPEVEKFITIKNDETSVTGANISIRLSDDFMQAVDDGDEEFTLRYPIDTDDPKAKVTVNPQEIWKAFIENTYNWAEPSGLFWDTIINESIPDCYADLGFKTVSTNPCFSGDTMIAVADGRNAVSIKQLAEEGKDVPVYSVNKQTGEVSIKKGRNPRITGYNKKLVRVHLDDDSYMDVTPNHKFPLKNGEEKQAKNLKSGDSLMRFTKNAEHVTKDNKNQYYRIYTNCLNSNKKIFEHRLIAKYQFPEKWKEKYDENKYNGWLEGGLVVHHKDYDGLNNDPDNLEIMTFKEHTKYHAQHDTQGEDNGRYSGYTNDQLKEIGINLVKKLGRRFSKKEWQEFAGENGLPKEFSKFRKNELGAITEFGKWCTRQVDLDKYNNRDPRVIKTLFDMEDQGYNTKVENGQVLVEKTDELTGEKFWIDHRRREVSFKSTQNALKYQRKNTDFESKRINSTKKTYKEKSVQKRQNQLKIFSDLKFKLGRDPLLKEWKEECSNREISKRLRTKYGFDNYTDLKSHAENYNHKVKSVEYLDGEHTVYNITVDDNHTVGNITSKYENKQGNINFNGIFTFQCGEIPLCEFDSCRLLLVNLFDFIGQPFTDESHFKWKEFEDAVQVAQRLMDDIVDLELEQVDKIIEKIDNDPEPEHVKRREREIWEKIKQKAQKGRRTGTGITAMGDMLAGLGYTYGTKEATQVADSVMRTFKHNAYKSSVEMAKERGSFPIWEFDREKNNPFLQRIKDENKDLYEEMKEHGRRNISLLTIAPAGTTSMMAQTTSGIENLFSPYYFRKRKINPNDDNVRIDFTDDSGDHWMEFPVFHQRFKQWLEVNDYDIDEVKRMNKDQLERITKKSPYHNATVKDVDWVNKVKMQGKIQKHIDHSISVTTNLPEDIPKEKVEEVYMTAWKAGCKGCTIYRENSRSNVLSTESTKDKEDKEEDQHTFKDNHAPKRPKRLPCDVHHFVNNGEKWLAFIGLLDGRPYEVFAGKESAFDIPTTSVDGEIVKEKKNGDSRYDYHYTHYNKPKVQKGLSEVFHREYWNYAKFISMILRHGAPIQYVVDVMGDLDVEEDHISTWKRGLMRIMKKYIPEGEASGMECPECGGEIIMEEGCHKCLDCGYSGCG